jgi:hypothetical protein
MSRQMVELILFTHVFKYHNILCVQRDTTTVPPLVLEVLCNQNDTDTPMMTAFRKYVRYVLLIVFV